MPGARDRASRSRQMSRSVLSSAQRVLENIAAPEFTEIIWLKLIVKSNLVFESVLGNVVATAALRIPDGNAAALLA
jgi:hypothetical protein